MWWLSPTDATVCPSVLSLLRHFFTAGNNRCNGEKRGRAAPLSASFSLYLIDTTYWGGFGFPQRVRKTEVIGWLVGIVLLVPAKKGSDRIGKQMIESVKILLYRA